MEKKRQIEVLLIEENAQVAHGLAEILKKLNALTCSTVCLSDITEVETLDSMRRFDLVIVSQTLLLMSTSEELQSVRKQAPHAPLVALTQLNQKFSGDLCRKHEVDGYLLREYLDPTLIEKTIATALERHKLWGNKETSEGLSNPLYDPMTHLPSVSLFFDRLDQSVSHHRRYRRQAALLVFCFKQDLIEPIMQNAEKTEKLLRQISKKLKACVTDPDTVVGLPQMRFAVLLNEVQSIEDAGKQSQIILRVLSEPYLLDQEPSFLQPAVGICGYPEDAHHAVEWLDCAEQAAMQALQEPNFTYFFNFQTQVRFYQQLKLERDLRLAWVRGEFEVLYRPQVDAQKEEFYGLEASLTWNSEHQKECLEQYGSLEQLLDETGLALPLSDWLLRTTCRQFQMWLSEEPRLCLTVKLPVQHLLQPNFSKKLKEQLEQHHIPVHQWTLSISETQLMQHLDALHTPLNAIKELGVMIAVSDAGQEHSKILMMQSLPVDRIALHPRFLQDHKKNPDLIQSMVLLSRSMKKSIMAYNVEDQNLQQMALSSGFHLVEGDYFGKARKAAHVSEWFGAMWK